jgi:hypothetical protein
MVAPVLALLLTSPAPLIVVEGDTACPTPAEVAARVAALLPADAAAEAPDVARIEVEAGTMRVTLSRPDGATLGEREIDGSFPCADLAEAAAVVVATWESDVHPEYRAPAPPPPPAAPAAVAAAPPPAPPAPAAVDLGAALAGSLAPSSAGAAPALGALAVGSWTPGGRRFGLRGAVQWTAERELELGAGAVLWRRVTAALGPQLRLTSAATRWAVDLHAAGLAAWLAAGGSGFTMDRQGNSFDPGVGLGIRALWFGPSGLIPWLELGGAGWLRSQTAFATPGADAVTLPRLETTLAVGVSLGRK